MSGVMYSIADRRGGGAIGNLLGSRAYKTVKPPDPGLVKINYKELERMVLLDQLVCPDCKLRLGTKSTYRAHRKRCLKKHISHERSA